jgi:hypothetical protein
MSLKRPSIWGIASLLLLVVGFGFTSYIEALRDHGRPILVSRDDLYAVCALALFAAAVCGVIAAKKQSGFWLLAVLLEGYLFLLCFFYDL